MENLPNIYEQQQRNRRSTVVIITLFILFFCFIGYGFDLFYFGADPLGGSWFVEKLTDEMEEAAYRYFARIDELGGVVEAIRRNFPQREIADAAFTYQRELDERKRIVVGVNDFVQEDETPTPILRIDPALEKKQVDRLAVTRAR